MKRFTLLLLIFLALPLWASAHILKSDGAIGVLLHVNPNDDPIVGQPAGFFFEVKDKTNKFAPQNCNCTVSILSNGNKLYTANLFQSSSNDINSAVFSYTFPVPAVYSVVVSGIPKTTNAFQSFQVQYDLRVESKVGGGSQSQDKGLIIIGSFIVVAVLAGAIISFRKK